MTSSLKTSPSGVRDADLTVLSQTMAQCCKNIRETVQLLASRHKDIHGSVSKVGKAIDRNFDAEVSAVVAETVWDSPERQKYLSETIVEHLYRQGMLSVAEDLCQVNRTTEIKQKPAHPVGPQNQN
uniref:Required for meiotic nuclear division 5 homolog B n=1 Tax=Hucho hucho TaxID=62062 RepID=A0A4W5L7H6_9TELE